MNNNRNVLVVLSGPSGVGKGTLAKLLVENNKNISLSISCTTRAPRDGEVNGREYFFLEKEDFKSKIEKDGFLEYSNHFENYYGTPKQFVLNSLKEVEKLIDGKGRALLRKSGTEPVIRIMIESETEEKCHKYADIIADAIINGGHKVD